jgi:small nuclear ribonucleoprotein (snRNP)-like protein
MNLQTLENPSIPMMSVQECKSMKITVETLSGERLTGPLKAFDPVNGNVTLEGTVLCKSRNGELAAAGRTMIRGSAVRLIELPRELKRADFLLGFVAQQQQQQHRGVRKEAKKAVEQVAKKQFVKRGSDAAKAQKLLRGLRGKVATKP